MLVYTLLAGLLFGLYFTLVGLGLNLVFGVMRIVNLAHGDFLMLGAFLAYWICVTQGLTPLAAVPAALVVFAPAGALLYRLVVPRLLRVRDPEMLSIIFFFGLSQAIEAAAAVTFGTSERSIPGGVLTRLVARIASALAGHPVPPGPVTILGQRFPAAWVASGVCGALGVLFVYFYLYRSRLGLLTRAVMAERDEAVATGIDVHRVSAAAFAIGIALAALAGVFAPFMLGSVTPAMGVDVTVTSFVVIVIGALGNPLGTVLGGLIYGVSYMMMQSYLSSWANLLPYLMLIAILLLRPSGLLGRSLRRA